MKGRMYYLCMAILILAIPMSCKDDDPLPAQKPLLSKIVQDEFTLMDFEYDDNELVRANLYDSHGNISDYIKYVYDDEGIFELIQYDEDDIVKSKVIFTHNEAGQVSQGDIYSGDSDFLEAYRIITFSYDASDQLASMAVADLGKPMDELDEFTYDARGQRVQLTRSVYPEDDEEYVSYEIDYTAGDKSIPTHWNDLAFLLTASDMDVYLLDMFNVSSHRTSWNSEGKVKSESRTDASNQQYNESGYLISQTLKRVSLSGLSLQKTDQMSYEYVDNH
jgi:hypothetical protein